MTSCDSYMPRTASSLCAASTLSMALLGVVQERAFSTHGQHHEEAIFYIHALGLVPLVADARHASDHGPSLEPPRLRRLPPPLRARRL